VEKKNVNKKGNGWFVGGKVPLGGGEKARTFLERVGKGEVNSRVGPKGRTVLVANQHPTKRLYKNYVTKQCLFQELTFNQMNEAK